MGIGEANCAGRVTIRILWDMVSDVMVNATVAECCVVHVKLSAGVLPR